MAETLQDSVSALHRDRTFKKLFVLRKTFRCFVFLFLSSLALQPVPSVHANGNFNEIVKEAELLVQKPFEEPKQISEQLAKINYDQWRNIRFKPENALWRGDELPFEVQFFHPGWLYNHPVEIQVIEAGEQKSLSFSSDQFHYGLNLAQDKITKDWGYAGFRLHFPLNTQKYLDEFAVFLGASYIRAVGSNQHYGLSARGVAIDTALDSGEEFPSFKKFWLVRPEKKAKSITIFALLDSRSLTGAYQFVFTPGKKTLIDVTATLFLRKEIKKLAINPLTSMFFYGENKNIRPTDDFRPEIHDSDGLQILTETDEWIWRPLINPKRLLVTSFELNNPKGMGLFQRDQDFDHYQDLEAFYERRPSVWAVPGKGWAKGRVELVQIPTDNEKNDNIVCYWIPENIPSPKTPFSFSYQLHWLSEEIASAPIARVLATRTANGEKEGKRYFIDFKGGKLNSLPANAKLEADISVGGGEIVEHYIQKIGNSNDWRLVFRIKKNESAFDNVRLKKGDPLELRAFLRQGNEVLTETWSYVDPF